jgi:predicted DNA binding protein
MERDQTSPLFVELILSHPELLLQEFMGTHSGADLDLEYALSRAVGSQYAFLTIEDDDHFEVGHALESDPTVGGVRYVGTVERGHIFRVAVDESVSLIPPNSGELAIHLLDATNDEGSWRLRLLVPSRDVLEALRRHYHDHDVTFLVKRLHHADRTGRTRGLSSEQWALLTHAYRTGYFDVPRRTTQEELADHFDISRSAISQRLRRAVAQLIQSAIEP